MFHVGSGIAKNMYVGCIRYPMLIAMGSPDLMLSDLDGVGAGLNPKRLAIWVFSKQPSKSVAPSLFARFGNPPPVGHDGTNWCIKFLLRWSSS